MQKGTMKQNKKVLDENAKVCSYFFHKGCMLCNIVIVNPVAIKIPWITP